MKDKLFKAQQEAMQKRQKVEIGAHSEARLYNEGPGIQPQPMP